MSLKSEVIGFIGLGMMGLPMVQQINKHGYKIYVSDLDHAKVDKALSFDGIEQLDLNRLHQIDILITMLPNSNIVEKALLGDEDRDGVCAQLRENTVIIDMSSSEPLRSRALAKTLSLKGFQYLDAPVSGGVKKAVSGEITIMVGGPRQLFNEHIALLKSMGSKIIYVGTSGSGHAAKALNNYVSAAAMTATIEALKVAEKFGIDPDIMTDVLNSSSGKTNASENKIKQFVLNETYASGFSLILMNKDLNIAKNLTENLQFNLPLSDAVFKFWNTSAKECQANVDHTEIYKKIGNLDG
ncbi:hypothetical protein B9T31_05645 [Acinetobacter sp. ANC 4558]|uniref:NAD(P)-dependent oxidoreductase n=1 Tax=Acinetobacter sp. ANC 4558 TaxID=1977876 RepID=UPI000A34AAE3|nr:NAD(P)-dependent oxidoreductase [Acinetobacter sp. ANC 4558]OTG87088.1 hypothetical protein B9T31_05645 [Acinetobacter sp. ANC 4558]